MSLKNKHIFIITDIDKFFYLQANALIEKSKIKASSLCAIVIKGSGEDNFEKVKKVKGVEYIRYDEKIIDDIIQAKTITSMSLSSYNSWLINKLIKTDESILDKYYIFITDDEVDRWKSICAKNGELIADDTKFMTKDDVEILKKVKNMIALKIVFEPVISKILNRKINFINTGVIFDTLEFKKHLQLEALLSGYQVNNEFKILYGTKGVTKESIKEFYKFVSKLKLNNKKISFVIFARHPLKIILLELIRLYLRIFKNKNFGINYLNHTDPLTYTCIVMSCSHIILQDRGGASTAKLFAKLGRGALCIKNNIHNSYFFEKGHNLEILKYNSIEHLRDLIMQRDVDLEKNSKQIMKLEREWIKIFKTLYN